MADLPPTTAQQAFASLMRAQIAPHLRKLGFKGSGQLFELPHPATWALIGFQKSAYNTANHVECTVNVSAADKSDWTAARERRPNLPERPGPNTVYGAAAWHSRIGRLMPDDRDVWWTIDSVSDPGSLAREVISAVTEYALPAIRERLHT